MEESNVADPMISTTDWIAVVAFEVVVSVGIAIGVALLMRLLFVRHPRARWSTHLLPWRGAIALSMLYASPFLLVSGMHSRPWDSFFNVLINRGGTESLGWFCIGVWSSLLAMAMTTAVLVQHWLPDAWPNQVGRALRTFAVVIAIVIIEIQMQTVLGDGLGGELVRSYSELDQAGTAAAWRRAVITLLSVDMLFGALQIAVRIAAQRVSRLRASTLNNASAIAGVST